ncbi:MAG: orotate phosphoribosyltransferase [Chitinophagales bacterium]|nr:orotate phosphoribosyltransferase [Chitinophagales bacterium]
MVYDKIVARELAEYLLEIKAVKLSPKQPFTWTSGLKSPIYCDNRKTLSYPEIRNFIKKNFSTVVRKFFANAGYIAGVATAGIPHGALLADELHLPFVYVRDKAKAHGLENRIEGEITSHAKVVVVEDLISTAGSSIKAIEALREAEAEVIGLVAIFTYGFKNATEALTQVNCPFFVLCDYKNLIEVALQKEYVTADQEQMLMSWYENPEAWYLKYFYA